MSLYNRRKSLLGLSAVATLAACGFTPVYAPGGVGEKLQGRVRVAEPATRDAYQVTRHFETRLGRAPENAPMQLNIVVSKELTSLGTTTNGSATRYHLEGALQYVLKSSATDAIISTSRITSFTGYSATGNTAATLAAERDASARLMKSLTERLIDRLVLIDPAMLP